MKIVLLLLLGAVAQFTYAGPGFSDRIVIGPRRYTVGININVNNYPPGTAYNVGQPNKPDKVLLVLQEAINDIGDDGGGILNILPGTYVSESNINIYDDHIHIQGGGIDQTILKLMDYAEPFIFGTSKRSGFLRTRDTSHLIISNLTLEGNKQNQYYDELHMYGRYGLFTEGCDEVWFDRIRVTNFQGYGFDPHGWKTQNMWGNYLTLTGCKADKNGWDGFTLDQTLNMYVSGCDAHNNGRHGFNVVTGTKYATLVNNVADFNGFYYVDLVSGKASSGCGFMVQNNQDFGTSDVNFENNYSVNNKKAAFCVNDVPRVRITGNYVDKACICFHLVDSRYNVITGNTCNSNKLTSLTDTTVVTSAPPNPMDDVTYVYGNVHNVTKVCPK